MYFIEALCYPVICKPLKNQEIEFFRSKFGNISNWNWQILMKTPQRYRLEF